LGTVSSGNAALPVWLMTIVRWILGVAIFLFLLLVSLQNAEQVKLRFYTWVSWEVPLILLLLVVFAVGVTAGLLVGAFRSARLKRQLGRLRRDHAKQAAGTSQPPVDGR
jgi:lipopolysaccharide assembly protein A